MSHTDRTRVPWIPLTVQRRFYGTHGARTFIQYGSIDGSETNRLSASFRGSDLVVIVDGSTGQLNVATRKLASISNNRVYRLLTEMVLRTLAR